MRHAADAAYFDLGTASALKSYGWEACKQNDPVDWQSKCAGRADLG